MPENEFQLSPEPFERSEVSRVHRKRPRLLRFRLRLFCSLHRPVSLYSRVYHFIVTGLILFSCVFVNVFDAFFGSYAVISMAVTDVLLTCILTAELILRLWSSDCINDFRGISGKWQYFKSYWARRGLDLLGIITFATFVYLQKMTKLFGIIIRLLHVVQVFQIYRLILPLLKLMISTIVDQFSQLRIALITGFIIFVLVSFGIYLKEMDKFSIFDTFWYTFITLTTIGYGDLVPQSYWGKILICVLGFCGICAFQLPGNIFGTGLAIKLEDEKKKLLFQDPAANLLQTFWRCYSTDRNVKFISVWKLYKKRRLLITELDKQCIRFILKFRYFRARHQFLTVMDPKRPDDSEIQLDLMRKLSLIENNLIDLKTKIQELTEEYEIHVNQIQQLVQN